MFKKFKMTGMIVAVANAVIISGFSNQAVAQNQNPVNHSIHKGSKALQFRVANNFTLSDFQGIAFSGKKHISENSAVRLGIDLNIEFSTSDRDVRRYYQDTTLTTTKDDISKQMFIMRIQYMRYLELEKSVKFFWAAGPTAQFNREITKTEYYDGYRDVSFDLKDEYKYWSVGGSGALGAEWFANPNISFHSEYVISMIYDWRKIKNDNIAGTDLNSDLSKLKRFHIYATGINFGLSVYF